MFSSYLSVLTFGLGSVGLGSPMIWVAASQPYQKTLWRRELKIQGPIFICEKFSFGSVGSSSDTKFSVILTFNGRQSEDFYGDLELQVLDVNQNNALVWRAGQEPKQYSDLQFLFANDGGVSLMDGNSQSVLRSNGLSLSCKSDKAEKNLVLSQKQEKFVKLEEIKFSANGRECRKSTGYQECDINLNQDLAWGPDYRPRVTFSAF